jgi:hypothetical protein
MFAEEGWLYIVDADHKIPPYAPVDVPSNTPEQIYNAANKVWNATQQSEQYTKDKEVVGKNFKQVLFETSPNYNITPAISLLLNESKDYGVFYNINVEAGGTLDSTIQVKGNNLNGYMNFTEMPLDNIPLCGAGNISGQLINENLTGSFVSSDDDTGCWFDDGGIFTLIGSLDNAGHYTGTYSITNANGSNLN